MGYTTIFKGKFDLNDYLNDETYEFLYGLNNTRRMKRDVSLLPKTGFEKYGFDDWGNEGEFYVDDDSINIMFKIPKSVINHNKPPITQPGLWCGWKPAEDKGAIEWDGAEKFYYYIEWLEYIIEKVLGPRGYLLNGIVSWRGENHDDFGQIKVENNCIYKRFGRMEYGPWE